MLQQLMCIQKIFVTAHHLLSFHFQLPEMYLLRIRDSLRSCSQLGRYVITIHEHQAEYRQRKADGYVQPPIMANREFCPAISPLGCAEKAHAEDTADEGGGQEKHGQDLDHAQCSAVLMGSACYLCGFGGHLDVHLKYGGFSKTLQSESDQCSQTSASRWLTIAKPSLTPILDLSL